MTEEAPQQSRHNRQVTVDIVALLAVAAPGPLLNMKLRLLLADLRPAPSPETIDWLTSMTGGGNLPENLGVPAGPAQTIEMTNAAAWEGLYLVTAAGRLAEAEAEGPAALALAKEAEERYFDLHLVAEERRMRAAALQDMAARLNVDRVHPELLGWRAVLDDRTTPECRWAHGRNFRADRMPVIGWPGAVHVHCRCSPGPAIPGAPLIPSA